MWASGGFFLYCAKLCSEHGQMCFPPEAKIPWQQANICTKWSSFFLHWLMVCLCWGNWFLVLLSLLYFTVLSLSALSVHTCTFLRSASEFLLQDVPELDCIVWGPFLCSRCVLSIAHIAWRELALSSWMCSYPCSQAALCCGNEGCRITVILNVSVHEQFPGNGRYYTFSLKTQFEKLGSLRGSAGRTPANNFITKEEVYCFSLTHHIKFIPKKHPKKLCLEKSVFQGNFQS